MKQPTPPASTKAELQMDDPAVEARRAELRGRGLLLLRRGDAREAAELFSQAVRLSDLPTASLADALVQRAKALQAILDKEREAFPPRLAAEHTNQSPPGPFEEALSGALGAPPEPPAGMACDLPAQFLAEHGREYEEVEATLRAAISTNPQLPAARRHLARLFMEEGEWMSASMEWENLRTLEPLTDRETAASKYCEKRSMEGIIGTVKNWGKKLLSKIGIDPSAFVVQKNADGSTTITTKPSSVSGDATQNPEQPREPRPEGDSSGTDEASHGPGSP